MNSCFRSARISLRSYKSQIWINHHIKTKSYLLVPRRNPLDIQVIRSFSVSSLFNSEAKLTLNASDEGLNAANVVHDTAPELGVDNSEILEASAIQSTSETDAAELMVDSYVSPFASDQVVHITNLVEPTFSSLGLSHGWPSGYLQSLMEFFHIDVGLPWWQTIAITTVCLRIFIAPFVVMSQKNMVRMNNHQPSIQKLQVEIEMAKLRNEPDKAHFATQALNNYFMAYSCHPAKAMWPIMVNAFCFSSMFFALRGMAYAPVESMKSGGLYWFTDLTIADPTFILPILTCTSIYFQLYLGADGMNTETMPPIMKKIIYGMPLLSVPIMINFPMALNVYWLTNNFISLIQAQVLRQKAVKDKLGFEELVKWRPQDLPMTQFHEDVKAEMARQSKMRKFEETNRRESEERRRDRLADREKDKEQLRSGSLYSVEAKYDTKKKFSTLEEMELKKWRTGEKD